MNASVVRLSEPRVQDWDADVEIEIDTMIERFEGPFLPTTLFASSAWLKLLERRVTSCENST
jgi:hypothetical protein